MGSLAWWLLVGVTQEHVPSSGAILPVLFLRKGLSLTWGPLIRLDWPGNPRNYLTFLPQYWVEKHTYQALFFFF